jgi:hypothetical protein
VHPDPDLYPWLTVAAIAWGILDCFFGYRVFKVTITILGALIGAGLGQLAGTSLGFGTPGAIGGLIIGALLGGGVAFLLYIAAVFLAGFGFGATLGMLLLANYNQMVALLTGGILGVVGGFVAVKLQKVLLILATALLGAFRTLAAVMYFTHRIDWLYYFQQPQQIPALIDSNNWLLPAVLTLAAVGAFVQFGLGGTSGGKKKDKPVESAN